MNDSTKCFFQLARRWSFIRFQIKVEQNRSNLFQTRKNDEEVEHGSMQDEDEHKTPGSKACGFPTRDMQEDQNSTSGACTRTTSQFRAISRPCFS